MKTAIVLLAALLALSVSALIRQDNLLVQAQHNTDNALNAAKTALNAAKTCLAGK